MACSSNSTSTSSLNSTSTCESGSNIMSNLLSNSSREICIQCTDGVLVTSGCYNCSALLCDRCAKAHKRVRGTKYHRVRRLSNNIPSPVAMDANRSSAPDTITNSWSAITPSELHNDYKLFDTTSRLPAYSALADRRRPLVQDLPYLQADYKNALVQDLPYLQADDKKTLIQDLSYLQNSNMSHQKLNNEIKNAATRIEKTIANLKAISAKTHIKYAQTVSDAEKFFQSYVHAVQRRCTEMIHGVEEFHTHKQNHIMAQIGRLGEMKQRLIFASSALNGTSFVINADEKAAQEVKNISHARQDFVLPREEFVTLNVMDCGLSNAIKSLGSIGYGSPPRYGSPPCYGSSPPEVIQRPLQRKQEASIFQAGNSTTIDTNKRCRPIYGADIEVIVKRPYSFPMIVSRDGKKEGEVARPWGACCNKMGQIIVADRSNHRIQIFDSTGAYVHQFGSEGTGKGQFQRPAGICVDPFDRIVVADKDNHRVQIFTMEGAFVLAFGESGTGFKQFSYPWGVACNSQGDIAVADSRNHRIQIYNSRGEYLRKFSFENKMLDCPRGVCFTPAGDLLATDFNGHRIMMINRISGSFSWIGGEGTHDGQLSRPQGIVCDDRGTIVVADSKNNRIQVFDRFGNFQFKFGREGKNPGELIRPGGIYLTPTGRIMVVDFGNTRVQIY